MSSSCVYAVFLYRRYKQFYVTTKGEDNSLLDIDNHLFSTFTKYYTRCDDSFNQADEFISITGVVDWWNGDGDESPRWDVAPRNQFDIEGATPIDTTKVQDRKIREIKNALFPQIMWGNEFDSVRASFVCVCLIRLYSLDLWIFTWCDLRMCVTDACESPWHERNKPRRRSGPRLRWC